MHMYGCRFANTHRESERLWPTFILFIFLFLFVSSYGAIMGFDKLSRQRRYIRLGRNSISLIFIFDLYLMYAHGDKLLWWNRETRNWEMKSNVERKDEEEDKKKGKLLGAKSRFHDGRFFFFSLPRMSWIPFFLFPSFVYIVWKKHTHKVIVLFPTKRRLAWKGWTNVDERPWSSMMDGTRKNCQFIIYFCLFCFVF